MKRNRINVRVSDELWQQLHSEALSYDTSMTAIVETALHQYFHPEQKSLRETAVLTRLDRMDAGQGRLEADVRICVETLGQFVFYWLTQMDAIPESEREAVHALGHRRFDHFLRQVASKLGHEAGLSVRLLSDISQLDGAEASSD